MTEDRNFYRDQANSFRALLTKLATHQATIGLETIAAQAVVMSIDEAINAPKPPRPRWRRWRPSSSKATRRR